MAPPHRSQNAAKFSGHKSCDSGDTNFSNCHVKSCWSPDQIATLPHKTISLGGYLWVEAPPDILIVEMFLICHVTPRDYTFWTYIKRSFIGGWPSRWVTTLPCLVATGLVQWRYEIFNLSRDVTKPRDWRVI